mmetsp:Transcript_16934/g.24879  ORF Transcript_16934/g.24879 Transcript_16934/m.24879 type:complete len:102 (-) Transcript_16934:400-705(-)
MHTLMQSLGTHKTRIMYTFTLVSFRDILVLFMCYLFEITFFLNMTEADAESYSPCQSHVIILYKTFLSLALSLTLESWCYTFVFDYILLIGWVMKAQCSIQ